MSDFLTTRAQRWTLRNTQDNDLKWTDRGDGYQVVYGEEEILPLEHMGLIAAAGQGGCIETWRCVKSSKVVAIKRMETHSNQEANSKLNREVDILRQVKHYHSVRILGSYTHQDWFNIIMQPVATCDLRVYLTFDNFSLKIRNMERLCGPRAVFLPTIMGCLAHGLLYIHKNINVRHRDVKPANILLDGRRVLFADFGLSKTFTETHSGTSGPSPKTPMYASPERARDEHRNIFCDIFSLACVFAEIFVVYKGRNLKDFYEFRKSADPDQDGYYHRTVPETLAWLEGFVTERCDVQILRLLRAMFSQEPASRPNADKIWKVLTSCTTNTKQYFCGSCCMPLLYNDPSLENLSVTADPVASDYNLPVSNTKSARIIQDLHFSTQYENDQDLGLEWVRNLRQWEHSTLDVVVGESPHLLARKRITSRQNDVGAMLATNEADILRCVEHRHIVRLHSTYRQGEDIYSLLYEPAAHYDLRSYMELAEIYILPRNRGKKLPIDLRLLTRSLGCLASAMTCVHKAGFDHGDVRPENILIHEGMLFLSKFSHGLRSEGNSNPVMRRFLDGFDRLNIGHQRSRSSTGDSARPTSPRPNNPAAGYYKPPEWQTEESISRGQPTADIFGLGCVYLEIYTVIQGRRIRDFVDFRTDEFGRSDFRYTIAKSLEWITLLEDKQYSTKERFESTLKRMMSPLPEDRPSAQDVHRKLRTCHDINGVLRCGEICCP